MFHYSHASCFYIPHLLHHGSQPGGWAEVEFANEMRKGVWGGGADGRIQNLGIPCGGACAGGRTTRQSGDGEVSIPPRAQILRVYVGASGML